jgi:AraC family transcriptional activator of pobA
MKIVVFGASGVLGSWLVDEALSRLHEVTAVARDPTRIDDREGRVNRYSGDATEPSSVAAIAVGHDAAISAVMQHDRPQVLIEAAHGLLDGLSLAGVPRLVVAAPEAIAQAEAMSVYEEADTDVDWAYVSPSALVEPGELAIVMLDEAEEPTHHRMRFSVGDGAGDRGPVSHGREIAVDRLPEDLSSLEVLQLRDASFGAATARGAREPHRHDYHEFIWTRDGEGHHLIDGVVSLVRPRTVTLIGRGQIHVFERARGLRGAVVRFGEELLHGDPAARANPGWLLGGLGSRSVEVPESDAARLESAIEALAAEARRPSDACSNDLQRHLLSTILLWVERWYDAARTQQRDADDADIQLYRRFVDVLERDFARRHEVGHYAEQLRIPSSALSRALSRVTGRATKELVTERVMLEAARLLRFTDLSVGEIAFRVGMDDQLYFSRAFKRHYGEAPMAYRGRSRGAVTA